MSNQIYHSVPTTVVLHYCGGIVAHLRNKGGESTTFYLIA